MGGIERQAFAAGDTAFSLDEMRVEPLELCISVNGVCRKLEPKAMQVLLVLASQAGQVVSRGELEQAVWPGRIVTEDSITNAITKLRKVLGDSPRQSRFIETVAKRGYRLKVLPQYDEPSEPHQQASPEPLPVKASRTRYLYPLGLLVIGIVVVLVWLGRSSQENGPQAVTKNPVASIAVLPIEDLGAGPSQRYFVEGLTHDLITDLSKQPGLLVIAPGTAFSYSDKSVDEKAIAEELGVRYLVRGGALRLDDQLRLNVRLTEVATGKVLWADRYIGPVSEIFHFQDLILKGIVRGLKGKLGPSKSHLKRGGATASLAAYDQFLRGRARYGRMNPQDNEVAMQHFQRAIELDPTFARAYAALALTWSRHAIDGWVDNPGASLQRAEDLVNQAEAIDPAVPQIHFVRGLVALFQGKHDQAAAAATRATELDSNYADAYGLLAWILHYGGRPDKAREVLTEALRRNPVSSAAYEEVAGEISFCMGNYQDAVSSFEAALRRNPTHSRARLWLAAALYLAGQAEDAAWEVEELLVNNPRFSRSKMRLAFPLKDTDQLSELNTTLALLGLPE